MLAHIQKAYFMGHKKQLLKNRFDALNCQKETFHYLLAMTRNTCFGKENKLAGVRDYASYKAGMPLKDYEDYRPYIEQIFSGGDNVLWKGKPLFFATTSGTTSGLKYIPYTPEFLKSTQVAACFIVCNLVMQQGADWLGFKKLFLSDHHSFGNRNGYLYGSASALKTHYLPRWAKRFYLPGDGINEIRDSGEYIRMAVELTAKARIKNMSGLPVWLIHFLKNYESITGRNFGADHPEMQVAFLSGMDPEPYIAYLKKHLPGQVTIMENYSATEGNIAFQAMKNEPGLELICSQGLFYEFVSLDDESIRITLDEVLLHTPYKLYISNNCGLWSYSMGDIVEFVSLAPYRIKVSGRVKTLFSPFGEHFTEKEVSGAVIHACEHSGNTLVDFMVTPVWDSLPRHRWYVETENEAVNKEAFKQLLAEKILADNKYYRRLIEEGAIAAPEIIYCPHDTFRRMHQRQNKCSEQTKTVHLQGDGACHAVLEEIIERG